MAKEQTEVRELQEGGYVMIDDEPCRITSYSTASPGKHGSAKASVEAVGVFDGRKRTLSQPVDQKIWVPIIERKQGQVINVDADDGVAQVMDLDNYSTFTIAIPEGESLEPDEEIEFLEMDDRRKIV
ncbi:MAG: translation initiation factor IF-5A [Halobacteriales archaeon]